MSGTSHDGIDSALAEIRLATINDISVKTLAHTHTPYTQSQKADIREAFGVCSSQHICRLNFTLGNLFADAALAILKATGLHCSDIDAISSHGQTIYHIPPDKHSLGSTLQIADSSVIAYKTGILTISDFRTKDMAAMGHGAPLVPLADYLMFCDKTQTRILLNIGGMANITVVKPSMEETIAFDTGPGNALIDEAVRIYTNGKLQFDALGEIAKAAKPSDSILDELLKHPYFKKSPPKSTGRETFGNAYVEDIFKRYSNISPKDIICTLTHLSAYTIAEAIIRHNPSEVIASGGGIKNRALMELINNALAKKHIALNYIDKYGITSESKEAVCFAVLGCRTLNMVHGNLKNCTGAKDNVVLGKITFPM